MNTSFVVPQTSKMNINDLIDRGGLLYAYNDDKPYTGKVFDFYDNDQKKLDGGYRKGLKNGKWNWWNTNGSFDSTGNYRKGLFDGHWEFYYDNGQFKAKGDYRDGDGTNRDEYGITTNGRNGKWTFWHKNGLQSSDITYKNGEIDGIWTSWNENGDKVWEGTLEEYKAAKEAAVELAAAKIAFAKLAVEKIAAEKAAAEKAVAEKAAQQVVDCQKKYDDSQKKYKAGLYEETVALLEEILQMDGCGEDISSKAQFYIGWNFGNKQGALDTARAIYQKVVDSFSPGLKYVDKAEKRLAGYKINDLSVAAYDEGNFEVALVLREQVVMEKGFDKELKAKNQYFIGYIYQYKLEEPDKAKEAYRKVGKIHSKSKYVDKAEQKLATL